MSDQKAKTLDDVELPDTSPYRVVLMGATYNKATAVYGPTGPTLMFSNELGRRGEVIHLDDAQAARLLEIGAVKEAEDPRGYDEMSDAELEALVKQRQVNVVVSQSADQFGTSNVKGIPLRGDLIGSLQSYDAGVSSILPVQEGPLAVASPEPVAAQNPGFGGAGAASLADGPGDVSEKVADAPDATLANVNALAEYVKRAKPTVDDMVAIAQRGSGGPVEGAQAVREAEDVATGQDPRATLEPKLKALEDGGE